MKKLLLIMLGVAMLQGCGGTNNVDKNSSQEDSEMTFDEKNQMEIMRIGKVYSAIFESNDFIIFSTDLEDDVLDTCNSSRPSNSLSCDVNKPMRDVLNVVRFDNGLEMATAYDMCTVVKKYYNEYSLNKVANSGEYDEEVEKSAQNLYKLCYVPSHK